MSSITSK